MTQMSPAVNLHVGWEFVKIFPSVLFDSFLIVNWKSLVGVYGNNHCSDVGLLKKIKCI